MAELLVRVVDKTHPDPVFDTKLSKRGDVIAVQPDGWRWGVEEVANLDWRIVCVPGVDPEDLSGLLASEPETNPNAPSRMLQLRAFKLDLDHGDVADLRSFFDTHTVVPVIAKEGVRLEDVKQVTHVESETDKGTLTVVDGEPVITKDVERRTVIVERYPVAQLRQVAEKMAALTGVSVVGPSGCRDHVCTIVDRALVEKLITRKPAIADPLVIGDNEL